MLIIVMPEGQKRTCSHAGFMVAFTQIIIKILCIQKSILGNRDSQVIDEIHDRLRRNKNR